MKIILSSPRPACAVADLTTGKTSEWAMIAEALIFWRWEVSSGMVKAGLVPLQVNIGKMVVKYIERKRRDTKTHATMPKQWCTAQIQTA
jgi:hypothetical protein